MKAAIIRKWGKSDVFEFSDIPAPNIKNDQLLIKVFASGINPVDWKHRIGNHKYVLGSAFPIILGYDVCGEVVKIGSDITAFKPGDIVFGDLDNKYGGGLAEYAVGHAHCFALKPSNLSNNEAAGIPLAALTALQALRDKGNLTKGQTVIINGTSGGVGHFALQIAKIMGAKTIAVSHGRNKEFIQSFKPDLFIDYTQEDLVNTSYKADVLFDVVGNLSFIKTRHLINPGGIYINPHPRIKILVHKSIQIFCKGKKVKTLLRKHNSEDMKTLANWVESGKLRVKIDQEFDFDAISAAHEYAESKESKGKTIVKIASK